MNKKEENKTEETEQQEPKKDEAETQSFVAAKFIGPGQSGFMLNIHNVDPWQLAGLAAELTDRATEGRKMHRQRQMQQTAQANVEMLNARKVNRQKTDD